MNIGYGPFSVQWTRQDGRPLPDRAYIGGDHSLTIHDLQPIDAGIYVITAVNQIGSDSAEVEIQVLCEFLVMIMYTLYLVALFLKKS